MFNAKEVAERILNDTNITDDEWLQYHTDIRDFLKTNPPEEERRLFTGLGPLEIVDIMCDGIWRERGLIKEDE